MAAQNPNQNQTDAQRGTQTDSSGKSLIQSSRILSGTGGAADVAGFLEKLDNLFSRLGSRNNLYSSENDFAKKALKPNRVKNAVAGVQNALHKVLHKTEEADSSGKRNNPWNTKNPWNNVDVNGRARKEEETGDKEKIIEKSKYKVLLFGGVDYQNTGSYGINKQLANYIETIALSNKYKIPLQKGDIQVVNSPLFANELDGQDVYRDILEIIKKDFDYINGTLILYGYSWGGQMLMGFLKYFEKSGIKIALLLTIDAAKGPVSFAINTIVSNSVKYNLNIYQDKPSPIGSHGYPNTGNRVKNINLTGEKNPNGDDIVHSNIDEYTLLYSAQVIIYALKNVYSFNSYSEQEIQQQIYNYASQGF